MLDHLDEQIHVVQVKHFGHVGLPSVAGLQWCFAASTIARRYPQRQYFRPHGVCFRLAGSRGRHGRDRNQTRGFAMQRGTLEVSSIGGKRMREATKTLVSVQQPRDRWFRSPLLRARENQYRLLRLAYLSGRPFRARLSRRYLPGSYLAQGSLPRVFRIRHFGALGIWPPAAWRHSRPAKGHPKMRRLPTTHHDRNADWQAPRRVEFPRTPMDTSFATQLQ